VCLPFQGLILGGEFNRFQKEIFFSRSQVRFCRTGGMNTVQHAVLSRASTVCGAIKIQMCQLLCCVCTVCVPRVSHTVYGTHFAVSCRRASFMNFSDSASWLRCACSIARASSPGRLKNFKCVWKGVRNTGIYSDLREPFFNAISCRLIAPSLCLLLKPY
jgi:hypothetical protein